MKKFILVLLAISLFSCKNESEEKTSSVVDQDTIQSPKEMDFKVLDSKYVSKDSIMSPFKKELQDFSAERYNQIKPLVLDQDIPAIQASVKKGDLSYEELVLFYLTRIQKYDRENELSLNSVISLNPNIIEEAREKDAALNEDKDHHQIFGIPVLLKDNIDAENMVTTAGAEVLKNNYTQDAFITKRLKDNGALILGKANLSEWAYFFCGECPSGYSAIGGQTLNPYGRKLLDTGGSSSGSAVAVAANLVTVAVGSETAGSILSPASQNSLVGLKPTIGLLSRGGIVPISGTLDTPGPITKSVIDNAILLSAMTGKDAKDSASKTNTNTTKDFYTSVKAGTLKGKRFGAIKALMEDALYVKAIADLKNAGAEVIEFEAEEVDLPNFTRFLNLEMERDLPKYLKSYGNISLEIKSVADVIAYNLQDSLRRAPYGQGLFDGIVADTASEEEYQAIKDTLHTNGKKFFDVPMEKHDLDGVLSIYNYHAGEAAVALYPGITVPMGYAEKNAPEGLTFYAKPNKDQDLLIWAYAYEAVSKKRIAPKNYNQ